MASDDAHDLLPAELAANVPGLYSTEHQADALALVKLFTPDSSWTWYIVEYDPDDMLCFGLTIGHEREHGYFSLTELQELRGPTGLKVERDLYFKPTPVSECK